MRIAFDTNILLYAADPSNGPRHEAAVHLFRRARRGDPVLLLQNLTEFFSVATVKRRLPAAAVLSFLASLRAVMPVHAASAAAFDEAVEAVQKHKIAFWDALIWATAKDAGCRLLLSEDMQDGRRLGGMMVINPFVAHNAAIIDAAMPENPE